MASSSSSSSSPPPPRLSSPSLIEPIESNRSLASLEANENPLVHGEEEADDDDVRVITATTTAATAVITREEDDNNDNNNDDEIKDDFQFSICNLTNQMTTAIQRAGGGTLFGLLLAQTWRGSGVIAAPHNYSVWASLLALCLSIVAISLPLLLLEMGFGDTYRTGSIGIWQLPQFRMILNSTATSSNSRRTPTAATTTIVTSRLTGLAVTGLVMGMILTSYSVGILAWTVHALLDTFYHQPATDELFYVAHENNNTTAIQQAVDHFINNIVGQSSLQDDNNNNEDFIPSLSPTRIVKINAYCALLLWVVVAIVAIMNVRWVRRISIGLTGLALTLLLVLWGVSISLSQSSSSSDTTTTETNITPTDPDDMVVLGDDFFVNDDFTAAIHQGDVLSQSMIQAIHMTGILIGLLPSLASSNHKLISRSNDNENNNNNKPHPLHPSKAVVSTLVVGLHTVVVFITGYIVSMTIKSADTTYFPPFSKVDALSTTLMVVLVQWPTSLMTMAASSTVAAAGDVGTSGVVWARLLYIILILFGLQLPIAMVTSIGTVLRDDRDSSIARWKIVGIACGIGFAVTLVFATDAGLIFMDTIDYYLSLVFLLMAILEAFAAGWIYNFEDQIRTFGLKSFVFHVLWNFAPVVVAASVWFGFGNHAPDDIQRLWLGFFGGLVVFLLFFAATFLSIRSSYQRYLTRLQAAARNARTPLGYMDPRSFYMEFCFGNMERLKESLEESMGPLPQLWYIFIKRVVPHLLLLLFIKKVMTISSVGDDAIGFGHYGGYPMTSPFQWTGIVVFTILIGLLLVSLVFPQVYATLVPPPTSMFINRRDTLEDMEDTGESSDSAIEELPDMEEPVDLEEDDDGVNSGGDCDDDCGVVEDYWGESGNDGGRGGPSDNKDVSYAV